MREDLLPFFRPHAQRGPKVVVLLVGGDKGTEVTDIKTALRFACIL